MGRKRKNPNDAQLPSRVYRGKSAFEWHPKDGGAIRLCPLDSPLSEVWRQYEEAFKSFSNKNTVTHLVRAFIESADFAGLAAETKKDYAKYSKPLLQVFGKMDVNKVLPQHIRKYMDKRGLKSPTQANREHAFFSRCYRFGYERGLTNGNPCRGVRKFKEKPRKRYITDIEYQAVYRAANNVVKVAMELAYLCCARQQDLLDMRRSQLLDNGIFIAQSKTGVEQIKLWTPRLRKAIELSKTLSPKGVQSTFVLCKRNGGKCTRSGFNDRWRTAKELAREESGLPLDFTFHDLKAKGISDFEGTLQDKQAASGHKHISQTARYDRKVKEVPVVGSEKEK